MADLSHLDILAKGVKEWNKWRKTKACIRPDLSNANLSERKLIKMDLSKADLTCTDFEKADLDGADLSYADLLRTCFWDARLRKANLSKATFHATDFSSTDLSESDLSYTDFRDVRLSGTNLKRSNLSHSILRGIDLSGYDLRWVDFSYSDLTEVNLNGADLSFSNLDYADLSHANLKKSRLVEASLRGANLTGCNIYGISAWDIFTDDETIQTDLKITKSGHHTITIDNIEIAQFIYLIMDNKKIRDVINTITSKSVLILGRFTPERKAILDAIKAELPKYDYLPIMFDFNGPTDRSTHETVLTLAGLCSFVIADITDPVCIPEEVTGIVQSLPSVPVRPIIEIGSQPWGMYDHVKKFQTMIDLYYYRDKEDIIRCFRDKVILPAEQKFVELNS